MKGGVGTAVDPTMCPRTQSVRVGRGTVVYMIAFNNIRSIMFVNIINIKIKIVNKIAADQLKVGGGIMITYKN